jgi:hypothetical protein
MLASMSEAVREYVGTVGAYPRYIGSQWILSHYDSWELNPHYTGPDQPHPDDEYPTPEQYAANVHADRLRDERDPEYWEGRAVFHINKRNP